MKVIEAGNITRASEQLLVAQPALGLQIRLLERDLGVALLVRHSRGVAATAAGRLLYERATGIVQSVEETRRAVMALGTSHCETVVLGLTPSIMNQVGPDLLIDARDQAPNVFISLVEEMSFALVEALERGEVDLALAYEVPERQSLYRRPLLAEEVLFVTAPGGPAAATIAFAQALQHDLVLAGERDPVRRIVQMEAERRALPIKVSFEAQSISVMKSVVARGHAASFMPYGSAIDELRNGTLVARRLTDPTIRRTLYMVRPSKHPPFQHEDAIRDVLERAQRRLVASLGTLAEVVSEATAKA
jgi:LysR family transcriptional regulator, nitrogen assimilation regulatory protein